jgi:hypothetical protein
MKNGWSSASAVVDGHFGDVNQSYGSSAVSRNNNDDGFLSSGGNSRYAHQLHAGKTKNDTGGMRKTRKTGPQDMITGKTNNDTGGMNKTRKTGPQDMMSGNVTRPHQAVALAVGQDDTEASFLIMKLSAEEAFPASRQPPHYDKVQSILSDDSNSGMPYMSNNYTLPPCSGDNGSVFAWQYSFSLPMYQPLKRLILPGPKRKI